MVIVSTVSFYEYYYLYIVNHFLDYFFAFFLASVFLTLNYFSFLSFSEMRQDVVLMSKIIFVKF